MRRNRESAETQEGPSGIHRAVPESPNDIFRAGELLSDAYEIRAVLGSGGMGQVFDAHDRLLNRRVAIKAAWPGTDLRSLRHEAQALAALRHPGLVTIHALGRHRGIEYAVMERIYGESLEAHIDRRRSMRQLFAIEEALGILAGVAEALAVVHGAGIAHRDVKPANVMLAPGNRVVLMDFGIFMSERDALSSDVTGSPQYMAPETITNQVARGAVYLVDIYAFGVLAFELLSGDVPYREAIVPKLLQQHMTAPIPDVCASRRGIPARLGALVTELLAKEPRDRPQSMDEVAGELRSMLRAPERISLGPMRVL